ncbi:MAG: hypothetical protein EBR87_05840, partial [Cytophagia bacterium]|nr:hypothetical protein [Cytophagia bacterium]
KTFVLKLRAMKKLQSIAGILFTIVFILFTYWQFNDPDPILWVPIYGVATYVSIQAFRHKTNSELLIVLFILSASAGLQIWSEMTAWEGFLTDGLSMKTMNQELAREAVGLWIASSSFVIYYLLKLKK